MKKFFAATLCLGLLLAAGCNGGKDNESKAASGAASANDSFFTYGVELVYPPMEYTDDAGKPTGFDIELAEKLAAKIGKTAKPVSMSWEGLFNGLTTKKYDAVISSISWNQERADNYLLTDPYIENKVVMVVKPGTSYKKPEDLAGKNIGFLKLSTSENVAEDLNKTVKFGKMTGYDNVTLALTDLKIGGRIDAVFSDIVVANHYTATDATNYQTVWETEEPEPFVVCLRKGDTELGQKLNQAIKDLKEDGTLKALSEKWFGGDITIK